MNQRRTIIVKVTGMSNPSIPDVSQFVGRESNLFGDVEFIFDDNLDVADAWFVIEGSTSRQLSCTVPRQNVFFLTAEASWPTGFYSESESKSRFLKQFAAIYTPHDTNHPNTKNVPPFLPWMVNANHGPSMFAPHDRDIDYLREMSVPLKTKKLSVICSNQTWTADHRLRLRFVQRLADHFGDRLDWYGNGVNSMAEKWDGLIDYEYSIVLENRSQYNSITEKIQDPFLTYTFPIYWGAPNIGDYFPGNSFAQINIEDPTAAIAGIEGVIINAPTADQIDALGVARRVVLDEFMFLNRITKIALSVFEPGAVADLVELSFPKRTDRLFDGRHGKFRNATVSIVSHIGTRIG